ncbi:hypothetical protein [Neoroseomonas soli]|uniref:Uncharacterized protein n=1 Tax=Neoroseomonas soli TaxID=1081025 RepID=A0A9X9X0E8_9PROT|nr:hypothetical protein [Neoroseomonas soli]MBR0672877.1 hypothetical protein [Neoroseomonas soli]
MDALDMKLLLFLALVAVAFLPARLPWAAADVLRGSYLAVAEVILLLGFGVLTWTAFGPWVAIICPMVIAVPIALVRLVRASRALRDGIVPGSRADGC